MIDKLNKDPKINGILVQLPLPKHLNEEEVLYTIDPKKDVDGFHPVNIGKLMIGEPDYIPCTPAGIQQLLIRSGTQIEGAEVVVVGRNKARCDEVVTQISKEDGCALSIQADIADEADVTKMVEQTKDKFQRIDILVNSAAVNLPYRKVTELSLNEWNWVIGINLTGTFLCCRAVLSQMIAQRSGKIINLSSIGGRSGVIWLKVIWGIPWL